MAEQYLRKVSFIAASPTGKGIDLSQLHLRFKVASSTIDTPNSLDMRIYNLSEQTEQYLMSLAPSYSTKDIVVSGGALHTAISSPTGQVILRAGYEGNFGVIFQGSIVQVRRGRENQSDTYVDITAADGDLGHNWGVINTTLSAGYTPADVNAAVGKVMGGFGLKYGSLPESTPQPKAPRGKALFGMARDHLRDLAVTYQMNWGFNAGVLEWLPYTAYKPGEAVVLTSNSGLIGLPQQTEDGVSAKCLLNPAIGVGTRVKIDNKSVQRAPLSTAWKALNIFPSVSTDGLYKVLLVNHSGDTRGNEWYSDIIALALDSTLQPARVIGLGIPP